VSLEFGYLNFKFKMIKFHRN